MTNKETNVNLQNDVAILIEALSAQLAKPNRAVVNSESAFVADRLHNMNQHALAKIYWSWVCTYKMQQPLFFGEEVASLQAQLDAIDQKSSMPQWGTYGT